MEFVSKSCDIFSSKLSKFTIYFNTVKSPAFTHLLDTLSGLPTIRANENQEILRKEFDQLQDIHSACFKDAISVTSLFGLSIEIVCTAFLACVIFYYVIFEPNASDVTVGLAVSQVISFAAMLPWGLKPSFKCFIRYVNLRKNIQSLIFNMFSYSSKC